MRSWVISIRREHQAKPAGGSPARAPARPARKERWPKESTPFSRIATTRATITRSGFRPAFPPSLALSLSLLHMRSRVRPEPCRTHPCPHYLVGTWGDCPSVPRNSIKKSVMKARGDTDRGDRAANRGRRALYVAGNRFRDKGELTRMRGWF